MCGKSPTIFSVFGVLRGNELISTLSNFCFGRIILRGEGLDFAAAGFEGDCEFKRFIRG